MADSLRSDFRTVGALRARRSFADLEFWLIAIGYDTRTHSFPNKGYLFYVILFFSVWIFTVLTLVADYAGRLLVLLPAISPLVAAVWVGLVGWLVLGLVELHSASRRSPFTFSETDATLLGQTPVDRRVVALVWMLAKWVERGLFVWAGAVVLGYALLDVQAPRELTTADLPRYFLAGVRSMLVFIPLHLSLEALTAAVGSLRLRGRRDLPWLRWLAPLLGLGPIGLGILTGVSSSTGLPAWTWPVSYPIQAALGGAPLLPGLAAALLWAALGLLALWRATKRFNLSRAVQETRGLEALQAAQLLGMADVTRDIKLRERLGAAKIKPSLPPGRGVGAIFWRNALRSWRSLGMGKIGVWVMIFSLSLGFQLVPEWGPRVVMALVWIVYFGQEAAGPLRRELLRWWLMRQLPFSTTQLAVIDLAAPALIAGALAAAAGLVPAVFPVSGLPAAGWLAVPAAVGVALAAGVDLLTQCRTEKLSAGNVPEVSLLVAVLGALVLGVSGGAVWLGQARWMLPVEVSVALGVLVCLAMDGGLFLWMRGLARRMR